MFEELEARRARLDAYRPFDPEMQRRLEKAFVPFFIYNSNAIEGNTLSYGDTLEILEGRLPGRRATTAELYEVKGQRAAYDYLLQAIDENQEPSELLIRQFHQLLTGDLDQSAYASGRYKTRDNSVILSDGSELRFVSMVETPAAMRSLVEWWKDESRELHPIERAARLHARFTLIHPFLDGNGRTARLLANLVLAQGGYVMAPFRAHDRDGYLQALEAVSAKVPRDELQHDHADLNFFPFVAYLELEALFAYDQALDVVEGRLGVTPEELVRRLAALEARAIEQRGVSVDEHERLRMLGKLVDAVTAEIVAALRPVVDQVDAQWSELTCQLTQRTGAVNELVVDSELRRLPAMKALHGHIGRVRMRVTRRATAVTSFTGGTLLTFLVHALPHAISVLAVRSGQPPHVGGDVELPHDRVTVPTVVLQQFVLDQTAAFVAYTSAQLSRGQAPG